jgi:hypothetical protein
MKDETDFSRLAYEALANYFTRHEDENVQIEVLPPAFQPPDGFHLEDGANLGIPKKTLMFAYLHARALFFKGIEKDSVDSQIAYEASKVVLLFDPEHITAANFRKRRILRYRPTADQKQAVKRETVFLDSILTSPLHRQSKSPTLWHHRAWLLNLLLPSQLTGTLEDQVLALVRSELDAVCKAGERHPKNYYAWQYARKLFTGFELIAPNGSGQYRKQDTIKAFMHTCALHVMAWCCQNPSDISGWSFLAFLLPRLTIISQRREISEHVLKYAVDIQWSNEALFVFLRTAIATTVLEEAQPAVFEKLHNCLTERPPWHSQAHRDDRFESRIKQTINWIEVYRTLNP